MRRITFLNILLGFSLYLLGFIIDISLAEIPITTQSLLKPASPPPASYLIAKYEPNHALVAEQLSKDEILQNLSEDEKIYLAREYFLLGKADQGEQILQPLIDKIAPSRSAIILLADHFHHKQQFEKELEVLRKNPGETIDPVIIQKLIILSALYGQSFLEESELPIFHPDEPLAQITSILSQSDQSQKVRQLSAQLIRLNEWKIAEVLLEEENSKQPNKTELYPLLALERISRGDINGSNEILEKINAFGLIQYSPADQALVASAYEYLGEIEKAVEIYNSLALLQPDLSIWQRNSARLTALGDPLNTLGILLKLVSNAPSEENYLALLDFTINHPAYIDPYGLNAYKNLSSSKPRSSAVLLGMARFNLYREEPSLSISYLNELIGNEGSMGLVYEALWLRATAHLSMNNYAAAKVDLSQIIHSYPPNRYSQLAIQLYEANNLDTIR